MDFDQNRFMYLVISYFTLFPSKIGMHTTKSFRFSQIVFLNFWGSEASDRLLNSSYKWSKTTFVQKLETFSKIPLFGPFPSTSKSCEPGEPTIICIVSPVSSSKSSSVSAITYFFYTVDFTKFGSSLFLQKSTFLGQGTHIFLHFSSFFWIGGTPSEEGFYRAILVEHRFRT